MQVEGGSVILITIDSVYRGGKVEPMEVPKDVCAETRVLVTLLEPHCINLRERGIDKVHVAELCAHLATLAEDWDSPEMTEYSGYADIRTCL
jgi:hypothetical protein